VEGPIGARSVHLPPQVRLHITVPGDACGFVLVACL
jgi:hypothetical protein